MTEPSQVASFRGAVDWLEAKRTVHLLMLLLLHLIEALSPVGQIHRRSTELALNHAVHLRRRRRRQ